MEQEKEHKPQLYKISYSHCTKGGHHTGEPLNTVCLETSCVDHRLICSICRTESHIKHQVQPMKMFIDKLSEEYAKETHNLKDKLDELEEKKNDVLLAMQEAVTVIAERFRELELKILEKFKMARDRILEQESMRKSFQGIYDILSTPSHPDLEYTLSKFMKKPQPFVVPTAEKLNSLKDLVLTQIKSSI